MYPLPAQEFAEYEEHIRQVIHRSFKHYNSYDLVNDIHLADNLFQETLARVCYRISTYSPLRTSFSKWTDGIIINVIKEHFREQAKIRSHEVQMFELEEEGNLAFISNYFSPEKTLLKVEEAHIYRRALAVMHSRWPQLYLILYYRSYHELGYPDIAKLMNIEPVQLHRKHYQAIQKFKLCIEEFEKRNLYR
jgi:RNA polymerase sigma factor (sigma-70 family)